MLFSGLMYATSAQAVTVGIAVDSVGSTTSVSGGNGDFEVDGYRKGTIKYYIPLKSAASGVFGVDTWGWDNNKVVGQAPDTGYGLDDSLEMFLYYSDVGDDFGAPQPLNGPGIANFTFEFEDLDLIGGGNNDPSWFREAVQIEFWESNGGGGFNKIYSSEKIDEVTDPNVSLSGNGAGSLPEQLIMATVPISGSEVWAKLTFSSDTVPHTKGKNTPEYVFAWAGIQPVPIPAALPLFLSGLLGLGVMARRRRKSTV